MKKDNYGHFAFLVLSLLVLESHATSNIVLLLVDDQEFESLSQDPDPAESEDPMPELRSLIKNQGATFTNFFTTTPSCCISRATIFSGMYGHHCGVRGNSRGDGCYNAAWRKDIEPQTFPALINSAYNTFFMGKYLNQYGTTGCEYPDSVPEGWDSWHGVTEGFYNDYTLCEYDGTSAATLNTYGSGAENYITNKMTEKALAFLSQQSSETPFMLVLAPPNPHGPTEYESDYSDYFSDMSAPSWGNDKQSSGLHYLIRYVPWPTSSKVTNKADKKFQDRYRTLRSVDEMVKAIVDKLTADSLLDDTYFIYTSDNGYHFNQHGRVHGKWLNYDTDIRVPFLMRGPGIAAQSTIKQPVLNMDLAPTILAIAGVSAPDSMDGTSFLDLVKTGSASDWRTDFLVEYWGNPGGSDIDEECSIVDGTVPGTCPSSCGNTCSNEECNTYFSGCRPITDCICVDHKGNTYKCIRKVTVENEAISENYAFCKFEQDGDAAFGEPFKEAFDIKADPYQLTNLALDDADNKISEEDEQYYLDRISQLENCAGKTSCT